MANGVRFILEADNKAALKPFLELIRAQNKTTKAFKKNVQGASSFEKSIMSLAKSMIGPAALSGGLALIDKGLSNMLQRMKEISQVSRVAAGGRIAFQALQPTGKIQERTAAVQGLISEFGVGATAADEAAGFDTVQAVQSAIQARHPKLNEAEVFKRALRGTRPIFAARNLGVPLQSALEAEQVGISIGMEPGKNVRNLYFAGEQSAKTPSLLIGASQPFFRYKDPTEAAAIAGSVAGVFGTNLPTAMRRIGIGVGPTGKSAQFFESAGLGDATELEKLEYLKAQGKTTALDIRGIGILEQERAAAVAIAAELSPGARRIKTFLEEKQEGALVGAKKRVDVEDVAQRQAEEIARGTTLFAQREARRTEANEAVLRGRARALTLQAMHLDIGMFGGSRIEGGIEDPTATQMDVFRASMLSELHPTFLRKRAGMVQELQAQGEVFPEGMRPESAFTLYPIILERTLAELRAPIRANVGLREHSE